MVAEQIVRLGESYRAVVVVRHETYQQPTGLSAFPDGGKARYGDRGVAQFLIDAAVGSHRELARHDVPDSLYEGFNASVAGVTPDSTLYLVLSGCPRGGECWGDLRREARYRLELDGTIRPVPSVPPEVGLPGVMSARRQGEVNYVRFSIRRDTIMARFDPDSGYRPLFLVGSGGTLQSMP